MDPLLRLVYDYLDDEQNENALFVTERLQAQYPDDLTWTHLRALSCLRLGKHGLAAEVSRDVALTGEHLGCAYVFAQACLQEKEYAEGIAASTRALALATSQKQNGERPRTTRFAPDAASINRLLGKLNKASGDTRTAASHFDAALEGNPFLWDVFTDLCDSGATLNVANVFKLRDRASSIEQPKRMPQPRNTATNGTDGPNPATRLDFHRHRQHLDPSHTSRINQQSIDENKDGHLGEVTAIPFGLKIPAQSKKRHRTAVDHPNVTDPPATAEPRNGLPANHDVFMSSSVNSNQQPLDVQRRSTRLRSQRAPMTLVKEPSSASETGSVRESSIRQLAKPRNVPISRLAERKTSASHRPMNTAMQSTSHVSRRDVRANGPPSPTQAPTKSSLGRSIPPSAPTKQPVHTERLQPLLELLRQVGVAYYQLCRFNPRSCLQALVSMNPEQQATPWVLSKIGRAQYELMSYEEAKHTFQVLRRVSPSWLEDLEVYSTVLWHLKEEVPLALLAHELSDTAYLAPQTWCAIGNSFSLQRVRNEAVTCFKRAAQLSPKLAQSLSLLGYEYFEMEEYTEASAAFRQALQVDGRHYPAWAGLGRVQEKLGQGARALKYYLAAEKVNPHNAVLMTYIARALDKSNNRPRALNYLRRAISLEPPPAIVALIRLQAAGIYLHLGQPSQALEDLEMAARAAPSEPRVHFLLGQAYAMMGSGGGWRERALNSYTVALSLAPSSEQIKEAMAAVDDGQ